MPWIGTCPAWKFQQVSFTNNNSITNTNNKGRATRGRTSLHKRNRMISIPWNTVIYVFPHSSMLSPAVSIFRSQTWNSLQCIPIHRSTVVDGTPRTIIVHSHIVFLLCNKDNYKSGTKLTQTYTIVKFVNIQKGNDYFLDRTEQNKFISKATYIYKQQQSGLD